MGRAIIPFNANKIIGIFRECGRDVSQRWKGHGANNLLYTLVDYVALIYYTCQYAKPEKLIPRTYRQLQHPCAPLWIKVIAYISAVDITEKHHF